MEMRIDELARRAGVPTRTIRYYTQQDLLPPPDLRGRIGYYSETHLERLKLIKELQEKRFLPLAVIRSVLRRLEAGVDLEAMLAPLDLVFAPAWDTDARRTYTRSELAREAGVDEDIVDAAEEMGFLFPRGKGRDRRYTQDDLLMLDVARDWVDLRIPRELGRLYRESMEEISKQQVRAFNDCVVAEVAAKEHASPEEMRAELLEGYRSMSRTFTRLVSLLHRKLLQQAVESYAATDG